MLNLNCNQISSEGIPAVLDVLKYNPNLRILLLHGSSFGDQSVVRLLDGIRTLCVSPEHLSEIQNVAKDVVNDALHGALTDQSLQNIQINSPLSSNQVSDSSMVDKTKPVMCNLQQLELGDCKITDVSAHALSQLLYSNTSITTLNLTANSALTSEGWATIFMGLSDNRKLETLTLDYNKLDDTTMQHLSNALRKNNMLRSLDLEGNLIGDDGGQYLLDALPKNNTIKDITLSPGNKYLSADLKEEIRQKLK